MAWCQLKGIVTRSIHAKYQWYIINTSEDISQVQVFVTDRGTCRQTDGRTDRRTNEFYYPPLSQKAGTTLTRQKGRDLIKSYKKSPYINRMSKWQTHNIIMPSKISIIQRHILKGKSNAYFEFLNVGFILRTLFFLKSAIYNHLYQHLNSCKKL